MNNRAEQHIEAQCLTRRHKDIIINVSTVETVEAVSAEKINNRWIFTLNISVLCVIYHLFEWRRTND